MDDIRDFEGALRRLVSAVERAKTRLFMNDCRGAYDILRDAQREAVAALPDEVLDLSGDGEPQG